VNSVNSFMALKKRRDEQKAPATTGHEWDGIKEYDNPDPFWLRLVFYIALFYGLGYWILFPSWPSPNNIGVLEWTSYKELAESQAEIMARRALYQEDFDKASFEDILKDDKLLKFALVGGEAAFNNNCAQCHQVGGGGARGYPNLRAGSWLWGGKIDDIYTTIKYGIRSGHEEARDSQMPSFGKDGTLQHKEIEILVEQVLALSNGSSGSEVGQKLFQTHCASCHGAGGEGNREVGAPSLKNAVRLYGGDRDTIYESIYFGRTGVMPYWTGKLNDTTIRQLAVYVHQLGGGE
jgi:cytochrome c oxidase cbb3-type subunit 3